MVFDVAKEFGVGSNLTIKLKALQDLGVVVVKVRVLLQKFDGGITKLY